MSPADLRKEGSAYDLTLALGILAASSQIKADDIEEWDSLAHIRLIISIEKTFDLRFSTDEISNLTNVGLQLLLIRS